MKVLVLGASGIVGQHLRLCCPPTITPVYYRHRPDPITFGVDLTADNFSSLPGLLSAYDPDVVVNLAGESSPDIVEAAIRYRDGGAEASADGSDSSNSSLASYHYRLNVLLPAKLAELCQSRSCRYLHISTQAVFGGDHPPYRPDSPIYATVPVNEYGAQKARAEVLVKRNFSQTMIVRLTFILGIRPLPHVGRKNPLEAMLDGSQRLQVNDRWFSPLFAADAATGIWRLVMDGKAGETYHLGIPNRYSRFEIADRIRPGVCEPVPHSHFPGAAERPVDTTYASTTFWTPLESGLKAISDSCSIPDSDPDLRDRATEIALFLGLTYTDSLHHLSKGFGELHSAVTKSFHSSSAGRSEADLLEWYRTTTAYIWELSSYHLDSTGFNYSGMCKGIGVRLQSDVQTIDGAHPVLCLGDGIGDLSLSLHRAGIPACYHDLMGSRTAEYARFRFWRQTGEYPDRTCLTSGWDPGTIAHLEGKFGAVCALDFLEHLPEGGVEAWVKAIYRSLVPGGVLVAQNGFAIGSGEDGPMPMHLACNDRFEKDWDPLLVRIGFEQLNPQWYRKVA